jgi:Cu(I)/Ag(I) efflux system membrane fusion protein
MKALRMIVVVLAALAVGVWIGRRWFVPVSEPAKSERRVLFYQSPMHPWIQSDQPGNCTICGMKLMPVYEGDAPMEAGLTVLGSNVVQVINVATTPARRAPLERTLRVAGTVEDDDTRHRILSAYVDGRVDRLFVNHLGAEVTAGEPLATLYSPPLLTAVREYAALLRSDGGADATLVAAARQRLLQMGMTPEQVTAAVRGPSEITNIQLVAPMTGTVVTRDVYEGQYVKQGDRLFEIADYSTMWFLCDVYERDLAWLRVGQRVSVTTPSLPGWEQAGRVAFIDPTIRETTRSARVRVTLDNPLVDDGGARRRLLLHRVYAEGRVHVTVPEVLTVPRSAVLRPGGTPLVYVERASGHYEPREVKLGRTGDAAWEVLSGLAEGERVVVQGNLLIDAQTQMNRGHSAAGAAPTAHAAATNHAAEALDARQTEIVRGFAAYAGDLAAALAADDVSAFQPLAAHAAHQVEPLVLAFAGRPDGDAVLKALEAAAPGAGTNGLAAARKWFVPFSNAAAEFVRHARRGSALPGVRVYECPMVDDAVPGAPPRSRWVQVREPMGNPFFGRAMRECGSEVKD